MTRKIFEKTNRGFKIFANLTAKMGDELRLIESSVVGPPKLNIYTDDYHRAPEASYSSCIQLDVEDVKRLIGALQDFVDDAESEENWRNDPDYKEMWG